MSAFSPTSSQKAAIERRGSAVLVSAGAGSGKTKVLTERLMAWLRDEENPADLDSFLVITFTRAAAGELRGRIMEELAAALAADPGNRRLRRQSALLRRAQIGTIHSFCAALLREQSHLAGLSPDFRVLDEDRAGAMKAAALERVLERSYERASALPGFLSLADTVGAGRDDRRLAELTLTLHEKMQCHARPEQWARQQVALLSAPASDAGETPWGREILDRALSGARYYSGELDGLIEAMARDEKMAKAWLPSFCETADALRELCRCLPLGWEKARGCFPIPFPRLGVLRSPEDAALAQRAKARREACRKAMSAWEQSLWEPSEKLLKEMALSKPAMEALLRLVLDFDGEYSAAKRRAAVVDYADLEHLTARLLTEEDGSPSPLARELSRRYTEIMVDEYQDVSQVQDLIFRAVSREGKNLFLVGDVKQSIYRFRLADPAIFTDKYLRWRDDEVAAQGEARRILLRENFRSRREVLEGANAVFSRCMSRQLGDLDYDGAAALIPGAPYPGEGAVPEMLLLRLPEGDDEEESPDKTALEAALTARQIRALVDRGTPVTEGGRTRPMNWGDVAILLRSVNNTGGIYRRALEREGIPTAAGQSGGFFSAVEISTLLNLLALIDNPHQDIPLIAVLCSPALGFTPDDLSRIRARDRKKDLYEALLLDAREDRRSRDFQRLLEHFRAQAPDLSAAELCWRLIEELDLLALCSAMADGQTRRNRVLAMVELAEKFEQSGYRGLHRFVLWLRRQVQRGQEPSLGSENGAAVSILSIHKSKGLEFPVVFLCDTARRFNRQDSRETVLVHPELGLGPKVTDLERRVEYPSLARSAIRLRLEREMLSEEMRLLYVAMTRARERLVITAALKEPEALLEKTGIGAGDALAPEQLAAAPSMAHWLISAALADGQEHLRLRICGAEAEGREGEVTATAPAPDPEIRRALERNLSFRYPHAQAEELPSKLTATELKGYREQDEEAAPLQPRPHRPFRLPDFAREEKPLTGAEKGSATHLVLQYMDFARTDSAEAVQEEIRRLEQARFLSPRQARAVDAEAIVKLFASPLGQRMRRSAGLHREFKFSLLCDAGELLGKAAGERVLLQGVVDCYLEEDEGITVIDYKTDRVRNRAAALERAKLYEPQLRAYAMALERMTGKPVERCVLYFLAVGEEVELPAEKAEKDAK